MNAPSANDISNNPLLDQRDLPRFDTVRPEHVGPPVDHLLAEFRALLDRIASDETPATWNDVAQPLEDMGERLSRAWSVAGHLHGVLDSAEIRAAYNENQPKVVQFYTELGQNLALYSKYKAIRASKDFESLSVARKRIIENELRDFRLSGAELPPEQKARFVPPAANGVKLSPSFSGTDLAFLSSDCESKIVRVFCSAGPISADSVTSNSWNGVP